jgi:hypothetical protein
MRLKAPFPWFGGKSRVAHLVWERFGNVPNYVEPFAGSLAVLLGRPHLAGTETVNDLDGHICNMWRSLKHDPTTTARYAKDLIHECDLHARHAHLVGKRDELTRRLEGDPEYFDAKLAGWWLYGIAAWIGGGWCSGQGPWQIIDGKLIDTMGSNGQGVHRQLPQLGGNGRGVNRSLPQLGGNGRGVNRSLPHLGSNGGGVNRRLPQLSSNGQGVNRKLDEALSAYFTLLQARICGVRISCGDWARVLGDSVTVKHGATGVLLDPPYSDDERVSVYASESFTVAQDVLKWCKDNGGNPLLRIALCGYEGEHNDLEKMGWDCMAWKALGGYANVGRGKTRGSANSHRERIWFSPHCLSVGLFDRLEAMEGTQK